VNTDESTDQHQPTTQMHTDTQSDVATQHRTAETKGEEQDDVIHHPRDDLMRIDESDGNGFVLLMIQHKVTDMRRPTDSWKRFPNSLWILQRGGCW
jgi:hypothetical protein